MSYCRWSTDNFQCDLYCYESVHDCWTTHIAENRVILPKDFPPAPMLSDDNVEEYLAHNRALYKVLGNAERVSIGKAYDGETIDSPDLESFLETLLMLRKEGYNFPDYVIEAVKEELAEEVEVK